MSNDIHVNDLLDEINRINPYIIDLAATRIQLRWHQAATEAAEAEEHPTDDHP